LRGEHYRLAEGLVVTASGTGVVSHAGVALIRALADNAGLTAGLSKALAWDRLLVHDRGRVLADLACAIADGGEAVSDFGVIGDQGELSGPAASVPTCWRTLSEIAGGRERALSRITAAVNAARRAAAARPRRTPSMRRAQDPALQDPARRGPDHPRCPETTAEDPGQLALGGRHRQRLEPHQRPRARSLTAAHVPCPDNHLIRGRGAPGHPARQPGHCHEPALKSRSRTRPAPRPLPVLNQRESLRLGAIRNVRTRPSALPLGCGNRHP
jgi:hypothetical protein